MKIRSGGRSPLAPTAIAPLSGFPYLKGVDFHTSLKEQIVAKFILVQKSPIFGHVRVIEQANNL